MAASLFRWFVYAFIATSVLACSLSPKQTSRNIYRQETAPPPEPVVSPLPTKTPVEKPSELAPMPKISPSTEYLAMIPKPAHHQRQDPRVNDVCSRVAGRLASVSFSECMDLELKVSQATSVKGTPLVYKRFYPVPGQTPMGRVLVLGGTHGDELTSVTMVFKWLGKLQAHHSGIIEWLVAPLVNPDGLIRNPATRTNAHGIDLNRNLDTPEWHKLSKEYWARIGKEPSYFPGTRPNSEPETKWVVKLIEDFEPDVIVSVHAPLNLLDFDAPDRNISPLKLGILKKDLRGTFPGSLGNYAGIQRGIPVITIELPHLWMMPRESVVAGMWVDTVSWLKLNMEKAQAQRLTAKRSTVALQYQ